MLLHARGVLLLGAVLATAGYVNAAPVQSRPSGAPPAPAKIAAPAHSRRAAPATTGSLGPVRAVRRAPKPLPGLPAQAAIPQPAPSPDRVEVPPAATRAVANSLISVVTLADIGIGSGIRFANLGGRRELFIPLPQGADIIASELVLTLDDVAAHDARRSLEILVNDHTVSSVALDGHASSRVLHVPLEIAKGRDQFLKLTFVYSGAATQDRCIDVRYVGDSLTIRPESSVELQVVMGGAPDVATTAALLPREVAVILPGRPLLAADIAAALAVGRSLSATGRRLTFHSGFADLPDLLKRSDPRRWTRGIVLVGTVDDVSAQLDTPIATVAGPLTGLGALAAVRVGGLPALLVSDAASVGTGQLLASPSLAAARGAPAVSFGEALMQKHQVDRVSFEQLGLAAGLAEVFGRADLSVVVNTRALPGGTRMSRIGLDVMVAPDGSGERAVVSAFVNERLLASAVAAIGEPTRLDLAIPDGLVGNVANIRVVVQRRSAQGDCRFEPQGYPAQLLGSSFIVLAEAGPRLQDFSDLAARWTDGVEVLVPETAATQPVAMLGMLTSILTTLTPATTPIRVTFVPADAAPTPSAAYLAVGNTPPAGSNPRVRFDRGRVAVMDRSERTLLDIGGLTRGAVVQLTSAGEQPGMWIKPLAADGTLPDPADLRIERGDVAILDNIGIAVALSTERDTLVQIAYPDQTSWMSVAERFRPWLMGGLWAFGTVAFLLALQRLLQRRAQAARD